MAQNPGGTARSSAAHRAGESKPMSSTPRPFADLPYLRDYLREVLRPRVDAVLRGVDAGLTETAWKLVLAGLAREQGDAAIDPAVLRSMLEEHLGLRIEARMQAEFTQPAAASPPPQPASDQVEPPDVVMARRRPMTTNPLAQAVMDNRAARF